MNKCSSIKNLSTSNRKIITFIGMMGTGKSKFGRLVAGHLSYNFYDIDTLIEKDQKNTIKNIFSEKELIGLLNFPDKTRVTFS